MELRIDDSVLDPDLFIKAALEQRIEAINRQLEMISQGKGGTADPKALIAARSRFAEALRPYRASSSTARPSVSSSSASDSASPATSPAFASSTSPAPVARATASASPVVALLSSSSPPPSANVPASRLLIPDGAVPKPRRFGESPTAREQKRPARRKQEAPQSGMVSFLKSVQSHSKEQVIPKMAQEEAAAARASALNFSSDSMNSAASPQSSETFSELPSRPRVQSSGPIPAPKKGNMLNFLEKMRDGSTPSSASSASTSAAPSSSASSSDFHTASPDTPVSSDSQVASETANVAREKKQASSSELNSELKGLLDELK